MVKYLLFSFLLLLVVRMICWIMVTNEFLSKKELKSLKSKSMFDRWFFITARKKVRNRFKKSENRIVDYASSMELVFIINLLIHLLFCLQSVLLYPITLKYGHTGLNMLILIYSVAVIFSFVILSVIIWSNDRTYYKNRQKQMRNQKHRNNSKH